MEAPVLNIDIPVIDGREGDWQQTTLELLELKKNFLLILPDEPLQMERLYQLIHYIPPPLPKWEIIPLKDLVTREDFVRLQAAVVHLDRVFLVETLKRPDIKPPTIKRYAAYCDLRGLFAHSDSFDEAKAACERIGKALQRKVGYSIIRIFEWDGMSWQPLHVPCI